MKYRIRSDDAGVGGRDIEGFDLGLLIGVADVGEDGSGPAPPLTTFEHIQVVVGVRGLEPGAAVVQVQVDRIHRGELIVHPIKDVLLVPLVVEDDELRRIQKSAGIQSVEFEEVAPVFAAVAKIETSGR